jgi:hypothetical protein
MKVLMLTYAALMLLASPLSAFAAGVDSSGGGDAVVFPNDEVKLADDYAKRVGDRFELDPRIKQELNAAGYLLFLYGAKEDRSSETYNVSFITQNVLSPLTQYRFVSLIPQTGACNKHIALGDVPGDTKVEQVGCTDGPITWIREDLFKKMNIRVQARTIIHERLRSVEGMKDEDIVNITQGLELALTLNHAQEEGSRSALTPQQLEILERMRLSVVSAPLNDETTQDKIDRLNRYQITLNGGGLIDHRGVVSHGAYVGVSVRTGPNTELRDQSVLLNSTICMSPKVCLLEEGAVVQYASVYPGDFGFRERNEPRTVFHRDVNIYNLELISMVGNDFDIPQGVRMHDVAITILNTSRLHIAPGVSIQNSGIKARDLTILTGAQIKDVMLGAGMVRIEENSKIDNVDLDLLGARGSPDFQMAKDSALSNLRTTQVTFAEQNPISWLASQGRMGLDITQGSRIDFSNEIFCRSGSNDLQVSDGHLVKVGSKDALKQLCR